MKKHFLMMVCGVLLSAMGLSGIEVRSSSADPAVKTAENELKLYAEKLGAASSNARFELKVDPKLREEEWKIESMTPGVCLSGGSPRGVLYAVYHYLEDVCGVRWWAPFAESVPKLQKFPLENLNLSGNPFFRYRGIYSVYTTDKGRFAARLRMNDDINRLDWLSREYGGTLMVGPPGYVNTFAAFIPGKMFKDHPEFFSLRNGKRFRGKGKESDSSQRCLSNRQLREICKKKLREFIRKGEENAKKLGISKPKIYVISQNDGSRWCECAECQAIVKREGALSGLILDFVNELARDIAADYPDILIRTAAYNMTEQPPKHIRPEKNVIVSLANMRYNTSFPNTPEDNPLANRLLNGWAKISHHMMMWDYNINFRNYNELAYPSEYAYEYNLRLYRKLGLYGIFAEIESPIYSDVREYKLYLWLKLLENPDLEFEKLRKDFARGYYGKAGDLFLQYRDLLRASTDRTRPSTGFTPTPDDYTHLDLATMTAALKIFDEGERLLKNDPELLARWHDAKISLNRSAMYRSKILRREYIARHGSLKGYPFPSPRLASELRSVWPRRLKLYPRNNRSKVMKALEDALARYNRDYTERELAFPKRFRNVPADRLFDFTMENSSRFRGFAKLADDPESEAGFAACMAFPNHPEVKLEGHKLPQKFGIQNPATRIQLFHTVLNPEKVKGPGYNWYRLGVTRLVPGAFVYCFNSWLIQQSVAGAFDSKRPNAKYEFWISMKFTGPAFPHGKDSDKNAIWVDRIVLIKIPEK